MKIQTEEVRYSARGAELHGFLAWDADAREKRPGVLVVHEWWGHDEFVRGRAQELAALGTIALAVDMYGGGKQAGTPQEAGALMSAVTSDLALMRARFEAALTFLQARMPTDPQRLAGVGYCFGGTVVLQMARLGLELSAVASFHPGTLATNEPAQRGVYRAKTLVCLGADDPFVSKEERTAFRAEMSAAGADFELVEYPGVVHGFAVPAATARGKQHGLPLAHDAKAERDSWSRLTRLLARA